MSTTKKNAVSEKKPFILLSILKLIRPHQWTKNVFVLAALVFDGSLFNTDKLLLALAGVVALYGFCRYFCRAESIYVPDGTFDIPFRLDMI